MYRITHAPIPIIIPNCVIDGSYAKLGISVLKPGRNKLGFPVLALIVLSFGFCLLPFHVASSNKAPVEPNSIGAICAQSDLSGVRIAIYEGYLSHTDPRVNESRGALYHMFQWMNATVQIINKTDIMAGALWAFEVFAIPEGLGPIMEVSLGTDGEEVIRRWIAAGGSYIGVRGSYAIAVTDGFFEGSPETFHLGLINGTTYGMDDLGHTLITDVQFQNDPSGPDLSEFPATMSVLFRTGRYLLPHEGQEIIIIANYTYNNLPAMVAADYGEGNLFISSPHFEYEENSDRDGTDYMDTYDDPDSEWPLLLTITQWLVDSSPNVCNTTTWTYPSGTSTATTTTTTTATTTNSTTTTSTGIAEVPIEMIAIGLAISSFLIVLVITWARKK
ncbi:MAG: hypothetical protein EAX95_12515 [Candidatus Thorarchaeota archaeon]|nr:hypothetical protein [Candidatus Thorarchaeota archaeon]